MMRATAAVSRVARWAWPLVLLAMAACRTAGTSPGTVEFRGPTMGATWSVKVVERDRVLDVAARRALHGDLRRELERIDALMSTWKRDSELSRFNETTSLAPVPLALETFEVLRWSAEVSALTGGAFDVTLAPLVEAWGFGATEPGGAPTAERIEALREAVGMRWLALDPVARRVSKRRPDVRCDVSAIAPGYAADRLAALLSRHGLEDFLVDVGGELVARGHNDAGRRWQVAVERPQVAGRSIARMVPLSGRAIATSGDYRKYREVNGERVTHLIDPRSGRPLRHRLASVTVVDDLAVRADALATGLLVLGRDDGLALAERLNLAVLFLEKGDGDGFEEHMSTAFRDLTER